MVVLRKKCGEEESGEFAGTKVSGDGEEEGSGLRKPINAEKKKEGDDEGLLEFDPSTSMRVQGVFIEARGRETRCICAGIEWVVRWNQ